MYGPLVVLILFLVRLVIPFLVLMILGIAIEKRYNRLYI